MSERNGPASRAMSARSEQAKKVARLRRVLLDAVTEDDVRAVAGKLIELAKGGELAAIRLFLQYALGRPGDWPDAEEAAEPARPARPEANPPAPPPQATPELLRQIEAAVAMRTGPDGRLCGFQELAPGAGKRR